MKILQDLSYLELENLIEQLGEKKFRAQQLNTGLMQGKSISQINVPILINLYLMLFFKKT